ncbi:hypothetical protein [Capnocytophaga ochracea]|jgi:hypothetical protein|nr:MAG TPA: hypothetical protein [Caudoviricetes sp.]
MENPKTYAQLLAIALEVMQDNDLDEVYATEDGQVFYEENRAKLHASNIESKVYSFDNKKSKKRAKGGKTGTTEVEEFSPQEETAGEEPTKEDEETKIK